MTSVTESTWTVPTAAELRSDLARIDLPGLVARHGTPLLVLDPSRVAEQYWMLRRALPDVQPYYAVKALCTRQRWPRSATRAGCSTWPRPGSSRWWPSSA
jgi:hypothetical protein